MTTAIDNMFLSVLEPLSTQICQKIFFGDTRKYSLSSIKYQQVNHGKPTQLGGGAETYPE